MHFKDFGVIFKNAGEAIEKVKDNKIEIELLASYDGTEVIKQFLHEGGRWGLGPSEGWNALEFIYVISGELTLFIDEQKVILNPGDYLKMLPIKDECVLLANTDTYFLYISSQPVFQHFSTEVQELKQLVVNVEEKDGYTHNHCRRILNISLILADKLKFSSQELMHLNLGAYMHDVGKVKIPDEILLKPGKLSEEEWKIIKMHPIYGRDILLETGIPYLSEAAKIVEQHHERFDGSGYPYGLKGDEISMGAHIVAVVDSFDAMTTDRVYRKALTKEQAIAEISKYKGTLYHPDVVDAFLSTVELID